MRELIELIESKAPPEYKGQRHSIYNELEKKLPQNHYYTLLGIICGGYPLLKEDPIGRQIRTEVWEFNERLQRITKKENQKLAEKYKKLDEKLDKGTRYAGWFDHIRLQVQLSHPYFVQLPKLPQGAPKKGQVTLQGQLGYYLSPCFAQKIETARKIAEIFHFFYDLIYPEIDPENIRDLL